jgi:hypothetical protein
MALAEHTLGHAGTAREALRQADLTFDQLVRDAVSAGNLNLPLGFAPF